MPFVTSMVAICVILAPEFGVTERALEIERLKIVQNEKFGQYLGDQTGKPLYVFSEDKQSALGTSAQSTCYGSCARTWPPVVGNPEKAAGVGGKLALFERKDRQKQLSYAGWPLYYYSVDIGGGARPSGQGKIDHGGSWSLLRTDGTLVPGSTP